MELNQQLKKLREEMGLTQEELALRLNVSRSAVAKWEQGKGWPSLDLLKSLALFFHTSIDALLGEQGVKLFEARTRKRFWVMSSIAIVALALAMVSTTLLVIELKQAQTPSPTSEVIQIDDVSLQAGRYEISYTQEATTKTLSFDQNLVRFRNLDNWSLALSPHDYLAIDRVGDVVNQVVLLDNAQSDAIKGYELVFETPSDEYRYFYHSFVVDVDTYPVFTIESDLPYLEAPHTHITNRTIDGHPYTENAISHTIYADNDLPAGSLMGFQLNIRSMDGIDRAPLDFDRFGGLNMISSLNTKISGYLNNYAYEGDDYSIRDLVSYDITVALVSSINELTIRQYDENDVLIVENEIIDGSDIASFEIDASSAYLKYYVDGSSRGRTLETGESEIFFIENGTPLVTVFNLSIDTDY